MIWWLVLVPIIYKVLPAARRTQFTKLNTSPLLISLHVINLAITVLDFAAAPRRLSLLDLYIAVRSQEIANHLCVWGGDAFFNFDHGFPMELP